MAKYLQLSRRVPCLVGILMVFSWNNLNAQPFISGNDRHGDLGNGYFQNPILKGDYPDPSVLRVGEDYYLTTSSFEYTPGLLIWHSKDLVNWEPVCHALTQYVGSVYAPDFIRYKNVFYIYFPANGTNWVVTAPSPEGPWSEPVNLHVSYYIDPGHVVGPDGKRYLHFSDGHIIRLAEDGLSTVGELTRTYTGWEIPEEWFIECFCLESPKLTYHDGYYYLTSAQGGTAGPATAHMVVSARSKSPAGPWENSPYNPIVHTYSDAEKWQCKGHGTLVEDKDHQWWILYHGYEKGFYTMGRQTIMEPIEWTHDGWFRVPATVRTEEPIKKPAGVAVKNGMELSDSFSGPQLGLQWGFFGEFSPDRFKFEKGELSIAAEGTGPADCAPLLCMPSDNSYEVQVEYSVTDGATGGLVLFYNANAYAGIVSNGETISYYARKSKPQRLPENKAASHGYFKIVNVNHRVSYFFSSDGKTWKKIERTMQVDGYNHNVFGDFLALRVGLVSFGKGKVGFDNFIYKAID